LIFGSSRDQADVIEEKVTTLFTEQDEIDRYAVLHWLHADSSMIAFLEEMDIIFDFVYIGFVILGAVIVASTLIMIIRERKSEIGMMAALGLKGRDIMKIFTLEGAFMGIVGSLLGTVGGGVLNYYLSQQGIHVQALGDAARGMDLLFEPVFYPVYDFGNLIFSFVLGVIIVIMACLYPAYQAAKMEPVEALDVEE